MASVRTARFALAVLMFGWARLAGAQGTSFGSPDDRGRALDRFVAQCDTVSTEICAAARGVASERPKGGRKPSDGWVTRFRSLTAMLWSRSGTGDDSLLRARALGALALEATEAGYLRWVQFPLEPFEDAMLAYASQREFDRIISRTCVSLALSLGDFPVARYCATSALEYGADTAWHALRLAWLDARVMSASEDHRHIAMLLSIAPGGDSLEVASGLLANFALRDGYQTSARRDFPTQRDIADALASSTPESVANGMGSVDELVDYLRRLGVWGASFFGCPFQMHASGANARKCDPNHLPPERRAVPVIEAWYGEFWDLTTGEPIGVLATAPTTSAPEETLLRLWRPGAVPAITEATVLNSTPSDEMPGVAVLAAPHGVASWSIRQLGSSGSTVSGGADRVDLIEPRSAGISSLAIGQRESAAMWDGPATPTTVSWSPRLRRRDPAEIYFQVRDGRDDAVKVTIRLESGDHSGRVVSLTSSHTTAVGVSEFHQMLSLAAFSEGRYRLTVSVNGPGIGASESSTRWLEIRE